MSALVYPTTLPGLQMQITREPIHGTQVKTTEAAREVRSTWETYPRYRYRLTYELLRSAAALVEFQKLAGFFSRHAGALDSFLFADDEDNAVTTHNFGVGDGVTTDFQLQRTLVASGDLAAPASRNYWPKIGDGYEPVFELNGSPSIFKDAVLQVITTNYTLPGNGIVHFIAAPANGALLTWTGSYYRRVRFENDNLPMERIVQTFWKTGAVNLISVKP